MKEKIKLAMEQTNMVEFCLVVNSLLRSAI